MDAALRGTPCLLLTASEDRNAELEALDAGADAFVRKEQDTAIILTRLRAILRSAHHHEAAGGTASLLGPKRILAVDDSMTYLHELAGQLRQDGYDVVLARSGEEAIEMLAVQGIDCILLDLVMPGLSGHEACRRIKSSQMWRDIPLVMLTAQEERGAMIEGINAGADDYITKSSDFEVLRARLRAQLRRKQFEDEHRRIREQLLHKELEAAQARAALLERKRSEEQISALNDHLRRHADQLESANRELDAFCHSVSHDLRAPLRHVDGFAELLNRHAGAALDAQGRSYLAMISDSARTMGQLIDDLLEFSRMGRREMVSTRVPLGTLVGDVIGALAPDSQGREIDWEIHALPEISGDPTMLRLVLMNLIGNAVKYTGTRERARIEIGAMELESETMVFVRDNGVGFDMQYAHKLFGVFQRLHAADEFEGTGIGLANVRRIVGRHGGRTWAEAAVDQGATFWFSVPRHRDEVLETRRTAA
jgi:signal transduction histidine kinase